MFTCWSQGAACAQDLGENAGAKSGLGVLPMFYTSLRAGGGLREVGRVNGGRGAGGGGGGESYTATSNTLSSWFIFYKTRMSNYPKMR